MHGVLVFTPFFYHFYGMSMYVVCCYCCVNYPCSMCIYVMGLVFPCGLTEPYLLSHRYIHNVFFCIECRFAALIAANKLAGNADIHVAL